MPDQVHVYAGTAGHSAWFSEDAGVSWVHPNSHSGMYLEARVWCFSSHAADPDRLYAGTDMGLYSWSEAAARWAPVPSALADVWAIAQDPADPNALIAGGRPAALYRSMDAGRTWAATPVNGLRQFSDINMGPTRVTQILFDPLHVGTVWATVEIGGVLRSRDSGRSWKLLEAGLLSSDVHSIAVARSAKGEPIILAATNVGLHRSTDEGESWSFQALPSHWQYVRSVVSAATDASTIFASIGNGPPGNSGRLLRSRDAGDNWTTLALPGEINSTVWCVAVDASDPSLVFCGTNLGQIFRSVDAGDTWHRFEHEFGELRALHWRSLPAGARLAPHAITRPVVKVPNVSA